jgi:hypothetical protein
MSFQEDTFLKLGYYLISIDRLLPVSAASKIGRMPKSCDDFHKIGHRKSGLFSVMGNKTVDNVYCDFTMPTTDAGID